MGIPSLRIGHMDSGGPAEPRPGSSRRARVAPPHDWSALGAVQSLHKLTLPVPRKLRGPKPPGTRPRSRGRPTDLLRGFGGEARKGAWRDSFEEAVCGAQIGQPGAMGSENEGSAGVSRNSAWRAPGASTFSPTSSWLALAASFSLLILWAPVGAGQGATSTNSRFGVAFVGAETSASNTTVLAASLQPNTVSTQEGSVVNLDLNLSIMESCPEGQTPAPAIMGFTFQFGDGFQFLEIAPVSLPACSALPGTVVIPMEYIYHEAGSFIAQAGVDPYTGPNLTSNAVTVNVTAPSPTFTVRADWWVVAFGLTFGVVIATTLAVRGYSRMPPRLPPSEA
jgi:hypothetical protein